MTPINCDRGRPTAAREGVQRMGPIIVEAKMNVKQLSDAPRESLRKESAPIFSRFLAWKMSPHT